MNKAIIIGNLGSDPDLKYTNSGKAVANLSVATGRKFKNRNGEEVDDTQWHRVVVWGDQGEACAEHLAKGRQVAVEGRIQTRSWEDKDGNKRYTTEIVAQNVQWLGGAGSKSNAPADDDDLPF